MPPAATQRPIAEDLFTLSDRPTLLGGRCTRCEALTFPVRTGCPRCGSDEVERTELGDRGTLWTWTSQGFLPKAPFRGQWASESDFTPWVVGLVEIPGKLRVESMLVGVTPDDVTIGMPLRLVLVPFRTDDQTGEQVVTFAFTPETAPDTDGQEQGRG